MRKKFSFECHYSFSTATKMMGSNVSKELTSDCRSGIIVLSSLRHSSRTGAMTLSPSKSEKLSFNIQMSTRGSKLRTNCSLDKVIPSFNKNF